MKNTLQKHPSGEKSFQKWDIFLSIYEDLITFALEFLKLKRKYAGYYT